MKPVTVAEFLSDPPPPRTELLAPWLTAASLSLVFAKPGVGKTQFALGVAWAVATGGEFLMWHAPEPRRVLYIDGEMSHEDLWKRLSGVVKSSASDLWNVPFQLLSATYEVQNGRAALPDLGTQEGARAYGQAIPDGTDLIVLDNLSCLARGGDENDRRSWIPVSEFLIGQRAKGRAVLIIHHSGKGGDQRGTSAKEDIVDTVIPLTDLGEGSGCHFRGYFRKHRGERKEGTAPFEAQLINLGDGRHEWRWSNKGEGEVERILALHGDGLKQVEIARELGINQSKVSRTLKAQRSATITAINGQGNYALFTP